MAQMLATLGCQTAHDHQVRPAGQAIQSCLRVMQVLFEVAAPQAHRIANQRNNACTLSLQANPDFGGQQQFVVMQHDAVRIGCGPDLSTLPQTRLPHPGRGNASDYRTTGGSHETPACGVDIECAAHEISALRALTSAAAVAMATNAKLLRKVYKRKGYQMKRACTILTLALGLCVYAMPSFAAAAEAGWQTDPVSNAVVPATTRAELYRILDSYVSALKAHDPSRVKWAPVVRNTENNVALMVGDGVWATNTAVGPYELRFADTQTGQVALFTTVGETDDTSAMALRLKVVNGQISEAETLIVRQQDSGIKFEGQKFETQPAMNEMLPVSQRLPRERMISFANGYFDTLQLNDGTLFTRFHPRCKRIENGVQTTNNASFAVVPVARLGCEEQFRMGNYRYDTRLRARRFMMVDEERGIVLASGFIDHAGQVAEYKLTDGTVVKSPVRRPHSFYLFEAFKLKDNSIEQIEANFITVPYNMPSPWDSWPR